MKLTTNERLARAYNASGWTRQDFFDELRRDCINEYELEISRSSFDAWLRPETSKAHRTCPGPVAAAADEMRSYWKWK